METWKKYREKFRIYSFIQGVNEKDSKLRSYQRGWVLLGLILSGLLFFPQVALRWEEKVSFQPLLPFSQVHAARSLYGYTLDSIEVRQAVGEEPWKWIAPERGIQASIPQRPKLPKQNVATLLKQGLWGEAPSALQTMAQSGMRNSFRQLASTSTLKFARQALLSERCLPSQLFLKVGLELEEKFPRDEERRLAEEVYSRALACAQDYSALVSGYRLALLLIWREEYAQAARILEIIQGFPDSGELLLRVHFWQSYCARMQGQTIQQMGFDSWILKNYPLSLYSFTVPHPTVVSDYLDLNRNDEPDVSFRPENHLALSALTRKIELLMVNGARDEASKLLVSYTPIIQNESEGFRLYWSVLLDRCGQKIKAYQNLLNLVHADPQRLVRSFLTFLYPQEYLQLIKSVDPGIDPFLVLSVMRQESVFNPQAVSSARAYGLMQLQVPTARLFHHSLSHGDLFRPEVNIKIGAAYLRHLIQEHHGSIELALVAYNAGPARARKWVKRYSITDRLLFLDLLPVKETREYVASILRNYQIYRSLYPEEIAQVRNPAHFEVGNLN